MSNNLPDTYPLISAEELKALLQAPDTDLAHIKILDCRFELADPEKGPQDFAQSHIPGARYVHIDNDLCGTKTGSNGRHPLPDFFEFVLKTRQWSLQKEDLIIAMDANKHMVSGRLWWMLRWAGYTGAKVLNGGWSAWLQAGGPTESSANLAQDTTRTPTPAQPHTVSPSEDILPQMATVNVQQVLANIQQPAFQLLDGRDSERFKGHFENMDPVAGHIPGATNRAWTDNLTAQGTFKSADVLREEFQQWLGDRPAQDIVHSCGSGVTACNNLLAMEAAGLTGSKLYPGSWSEYCADTSRPIERS